MTAQEYDAEIARLRGLLRQALGPVALAFAQNPKKHEALLKAINEAVGDAK